MSTNIDWCDETLNPLGWGCYGPGGTKEKPNICGKGYRCYAAEMARKAREGKGIINNKCKKCLNFEPHYHLERLKGFNGKKSKKIFIQSMGDLFGNWVDAGFIRVVLDFCRARSQHTFMFLTKNPGRYFDFDFPANCWLGWTVTTGKGTHAFCMASLNKTFISIEPILGSFENTDFLGIDLVIIGAQTGPGAIPPKKEWIESIKHPNIYYKKNLTDIYPEFKNEKHATT